MNLSIITYLLMGYFLLILYGCLAIDGLTNFVIKFMTGLTFVIRMNFSDNTHAICQAANK